MLFQRWSMLLSVILVFLISSCSSPEEQEKKGTLEQTTEAIATEAVNRIEAPIDKANQAKELLESHHVEIQESKERKE